MRPAAAAVRLWGSRDGGSSTTATLRTTPSPLLLDSELEAGVDSLVAGVCDAEPPESSPPEPPDVGSPPQAAKSDAADAPTGRIPPIRTKSRRDQRVSAPAIGVPRSTVLLPSSLVASPPTRQFS